jgi:hypothetical protein
MAHDDGRCATNAETIFVENVTGKCNNASGAGSTAMPYCALQEGINAAKAGGKAMVVLRGPEAVDRVQYTGAGKLALVGQANALLGPGAGVGLIVSGGELYARGLTIEGGTKQAVEVGIGAKLQLENSKVTNNKQGGILVNGGTLVLRNSTVSGNGPGDFMGMGIFWGGIRMQSPAVGTSLEKVSVVNNNNTGISCSAAVTGSGVSVSGNVGIDIAPTCGFSSCGAASATCGAQP